MQKINRLGGSQSGTFPEAATRDTMFIFYAVGVLCWLVVATNTGKKECIRVYYMNEKKSATEKQYLRVDGIFDMSDASRAVLYQ